MKSKKTGIKYIAEIAGVSVATVSRALRDTYDVNPETRLKILEIARQIDYRPNMQAAALASGRSKIVAVVIPFITNYYYSSVISGIQHKAYENGYNIVLYVSGDSYEREMEILSSINPSAIDGVLISLASDTEMTDHYHIFSLSGVPIVFYDKVPPFHKFSKVTQNDFNGAYIATKHLIDQGYTRIGHIGGPLHLSISQSRFEGYRQALLDNGLEMNPDWIVHIGFTQQCGEKVVATLTEKNEMPDAIFAINDRTAVGAILALNKAGFEVGSQIGVVGFTNDPISTIVSPALSTVEEPAFLLGCNSFELLMKHIENPNYTPRNVVLEGNLIIRQSTGRGGK